jgi:hypothetical protein
VGEEQGQDSDVRLAKGSIAPGDPRYHKEEREQHHGQQDAIAEPTTIEKMKSVCCAENASRFGPSPNPFPNHPPRRLHGLNRGSPPPWSSIQEGEEFC